MAVPNFITKSLCHQARSWSRRSRTASRRYSSSVSLHPVTSSSSSTSESLYPSPLREDDGQLDPCGSSSNSMFLNKPTASLPSSLFSTSCQCQSSMIPCRDCGGNSDRQVLQLSQMNSHRRRRGQWGQNGLTLCLVLVFFIVGCSNIVPADACSSRSTPKPRPRSQSAIRPNITFQTYACPPAYATWYCLNEATCFSVKIADSILYNCECADGYVGQRCEFKDLDGSYLPALHNRLVRLKNSRLGQAGLAVLAVILVACTVSFVVTKWRTSIKMKKANEEARNHFIGSHPRNNSSIGEQSVSYSISRECDLVYDYHPNIRFVGTSWDQNWNSVSVVPGSRFHHPQYPSSLEDHLAHSRQRSHHTKIFM